MGQVILSENQKVFLVEVFKRWGTNPLSQDDAWEMEINRDEVEGLIEERYLVNVNREDKKIKCSLSIKGQEFAKNYLSKFSL